MTELIKKFIYKFLWYLIHFIYDIKNRLENNYKLIKTKFSCAYIKNNPGKVLEFVHNKTSKLQKIPSHLSILLDNEEISCKDLANLILWSIAAGISHISFYDFEGKLKANENKLHNQIEKNLIKDYHVIWHESNHNGFKNGYTGKKIHVKLLCRLDGRQSVAETCKEVIKEDVLTIDLVDKYLRKKFVFPDPDLALYCGDYFNLKGYPPWQIRLTEFLPIKSHHNISFITFVDALVKYSRCEQRVGT